MDFFEEVDSIGIVEQHIKAVLSLEEKEATTLLRRYTEVRQSLRDRLDRQAEGTFTAQRLQGVLVQVNAAIEAMTLSLNGVMKQKAAIFARMGADDGITELQRFEQEFRGAVTPINIDRILVADETANFLINRYDASISAYSESVRSQIVMGLTNESLMESPYSTVVRRLGAFFQGEEWRLHRIARTEFHHTYNLAKMNGLVRTREQVMPDLMKTLIHPMDARTGADSKVAARANLIVPLDEPFEYDYQGKTRRFMMPPDRPNDRAVLVGYRKSWED